MNDIADQTCVGFNPRENERDYVAFVDGNGCSAAVGRQGGRQTVVLEDGCFVRNFYNLTVRTVMAVNISLHLYFPVVR